MTETEGLLGVAFHPRFRENRKSYLMHEFMEKNQRAMIIAEPVAQEDLRSDSGGTSRRVLKIDVLTEVHHGGGLQFAPDGYLYIGMGDSGSAAGMRHGTEQREFVRDLRVLRQQFLRRYFDRGCHGWARMKRFLRRILVSV